MEILGKFGFDLGLFIAQIVNFLILAFVFQKFMYKPLLTMLSDRRKKIAEGLADAEKAAIAREEAEKEREKIVAAATTEAQKIIDETKKHAEDVREEVLAKARQESEKIINNAKTQSELEMERMRKEAGSMSLSLSKSILRNVVKQLFSKSDQETLIKKGVKEIEKNG